MGVAPQLYPHYKRSTKHFLQKMMKISVIAFVFLSLGTVIAGPYFLKDTTSDGTTAEDACQACCTATTPAPDTTTTKTDDTTTTNTDDTTTTTTPTTTSTTTTPTTTPTTTSTTPTTTTTTKPADGQEKSDTTTAGPCPGCNCADYTT